VVRRFREAFKLLGDLLDRYEDGVLDVRAYPDIDGFGEVTEIDRFQRELKRAEATGAVSITMGTGRQSDTIVRVDLSDPRLLYAYVGRVPASTIAETSASRALAGSSLHPAIRDRVKDVIGAWARNKQWCGLMPGDEAGLRKTLLLAQAIVDGRHAGLDYRTFSRRHAGGSKDLEDLEVAVLRMLGAALPLPVGLDARATFSELGLDRFGPPLLLAGPIALDGMMIPISMPYLGIPAREHRRVTFVRPPSYVLTVENQTSFNRQVIETDPGRLGLVIYTGGYPSLDAQRAISHFAAALPAVSFHHWSDIDPDGTWIFRTVERAVSRPIVPHLMDRELAEAKGAPLPTPVNLRSDLAQASGIADLVAYFEEPGAKWLEQEELDPIMPELRFGMTRL